MTTLHSGGKFEGKAYSAPRGGLHGVGVSVVNALSTDTIVEVARDKILYRQTFARGLATSKLQESRRRPQPPRHHRRLHPRPRNLRRRRRLLPRAPVQARPLQGLSVRRGRDPLALRPLARLRRRPRNRRLPVRQRPRRPSRRAAGRAPVRHQPAVRRQQAFPATTDGESRAAPNGRSPGRSTATAAKAIIATPSPPPTAAPTRRACAPR